jgi:uncharacterized membrane protein YfcA
MQYVNLKTVLFLVALACVASLFGFKGLEWLSADAAKWTLFAVAAVALAKWCGLKPPATQ